MGLQTLANVVGAGQIIQNQKNDYIQNILKEKNRISDFEFTKIIGQIIICVMQRTWWRGFELHKVTSLIRNRFQKKPNNYVLIIVRFYDCTYAIWQLNEN